MSTKKEDISVDRRSPPAYRGSFGPYCGRLVDLASRRIQYEAGDFAEHRVRLGEVAFVEQLRRRRQRPVEGVELRAPVGDARRVEVVHALVVVVRPPRRVTLVQVARHLQRSCSRNATRA